MSTPDQDVEERYHELLHWFEGHKSMSRISYYALQVIIIVFSALTPVIILIDVDDGNKWIEGLLPAIAAVAASMQTLFKFNETWVSRAEASERLKSEYVYFKSRIGSLYSSNLPKEKVLENFLNRIEQINRQERITWTSIREKSEQENEN